MYCGSSDGAPLCPRASDRYAVNLRLIALLLAAWCALMIVPAIVISAVAPITFDSEPPGWIFGAWIGTYLVLWLAD